MDYIFHMKMAHIIFVFQLQSKNEKVRKAIRLYNSKHKFLFLIKNSILVGNVST